MKDLIIATILFILILLVLVTSSCNTLRGVGRDLGMVKPEIVKPVVVPGPKEQLWQAAKRSNWLVMASIIGIAAGVFALVNGSVKLGTASIASASVSLFMALAVARFALWMAVFGLIGSVAAALFSILVRRKALVEIIKGVQVYKNNNLVEPKHRATLTGTLRKQSNTTKRIVGNLKNELKLKGAI